MLTTLTLIAGLLAPAGSSHIKFDVQPAGALVQVDGKGIRGTAIKVRPGKHSVRVSKAGYIASKRTVTTKGGETLEVKFRLKRSKKRGAVAVGKKAAKPKARTPIKRKTAAPKKTPARGKSPKVTAKPNTRRPTRHPTKKSPKVTLSPTKKPKKPVGKRPVKRRPVTKRPVKKRPVARKPVKRKPRGRRPVKRRPVAAAPVAGGGGGGVEDSRGGGTSTKPFAVLAFVVAGVAVTGGVIAGLAAEGTAEDFNASVDRSEKQKLKRDADNLALGSNIAYGVGATAAVLGAVLWAMDDSDDGYAWQAAPLPEGGAVVGIGGVF